MDMGTINYNVEVLEEAMVMKNITRAVSRDILCIAKRGRPKNVLHANKCWTYFLNVIYAFNLNEA